MEKENRFTLKKSERLCGNIATSRIFTEGKSGFSHPFRYFWRVIEPVGEAPAVSVLFSVPKRQFKRAVKRNLLKRRMREAYRLNKRLIGDIAAEKGKRVELAVIYSNKEINDFKTIEHGIRKILAEVGKRI